MLSLRTGFAPYATFFTFLCLFSGGVCATQGNVVAGAKKAVVCVACHGADGMGKAPHYPNLAGQKAAYTEQQLENFRSGKRVAAEMAAMAKPLSDQDIADLAKYFESL